MLKSIVASALLTLFCIGLAFGADKRSFRPGTKPGGNYNQDIVMDGTLYVSGQGGEDSAGKIPNDFDAEVRQSLENNGAVLKAAGMTSADFVSVQVYLADGAKFQRMNSGYTSYFKEPRPTRTTVVVSRLVGPGNIEITVIAKK
jgi:2-iminobutanoate/2-iminopropanoate deaminase